MVCLFQSLADEANCFVGVARLLCACAVARCVVLGDPLTAPCAASPRSLGGEERLLVSLPAVWSAILIVSALLPPELADPLLVVVAASPSERSLSLATCVVEGATVAICAL